MEFMKINKVNWYSSQRNERLVVAITGKHVWDKPVTHHGNTTLLNAHTEYWMPQKQRLFFFSEDLIIFCRWLLNIVQQTCRLCVIWSFLFTKIMKQVFDIELRLTCHLFLNNFCTSMISVSRLYLWLTFAGVCHLMYQILKYQYTPTIGHKL